MLDQCLENLVSDDVLGGLFLNARTHNAWQQRPVSTDTLHKLYELTVMGPTSANCLPMRVCFVATPQAKARLVPLMSAGNQEKTRQAPVSAIVAYDLDFPDHLPRLFPHEPSAPEWFTATPQATREAALKNGSLQGGYFIIAARALGLDCGPMGGFDAQAVAEAFFPGKRYEVNFVCNLGYGDASALLPRLPRPAFDEVCRVV